jgi:predicted 3-demethylubiquinone-9 3-methyltransferase (glyoxalase superfamily)
MTNLPPLALCLWLDGKAKEAAEFYTAIFLNSRIGSTSYSGPNSPVPEGTVLG